ncbi:MAG: T9SS type A sorting domain-containing protein [Flavobacteriales bacterium]|nr:T9SS type A sorting domain-containing protein [Flavobacteriales bacterium]
MRLASTLFLVLALSWMAHAQSVLVYRNDFVTPNAPPVNASCQQDFSDTPVNTLWEGTGTGTFSGAFQQTSTVETISINGPADVYDDPTNEHGDFCLGMLNTHFGDKLALLIDREGFPFVNLSMDMSAINTTCGGPFILGTPNFLVEALDAPGGVFDIGTAVVLSSDTLVGSAPNAPSGAGSFVFNWATATGSLDVSASTEDQVAIRFTLLNTGATPTAPIYSAFDDIYIEASTVEVISSVPEHRELDLQVWPNPAMDHLIISGAANGTAVELVSVIGEQVALLTTSSLGVVDVSALAPGTYVLQMNMDGARRQARFVKH